jgi:vancomycin permeability regulator SanA
MDVHKVPLPRMISRHRWRYLIGVAVVGLCIFTVAVVYPYAATRAYRYSDPAAVPPRRVALVFGAGVVRGWPTPALAQRIRGAADLYHQGQVEKLLMTGDNSRVEYDEVSAMRLYAIELGVPAEDITLDYAGFSTYESCYRARDIFGVQEAVLVTQHYHLPRAVYTCRQLGVDAVGYGLPDWLHDRANMPVRYSDREMVLYTAREVLATLKALWQVHVSRPLPTFLGPFEGIG